MGSLASLLHVNCQEFQLWLEVGTWSEEGAWRGKSLCDPELLVAQRLGGNASAWWEVGFSDARELGGPCLVWGASVHLSGYVLEFWSQTVCVLRQGA